MYTLIQRYRIFIYSVLFLLAAQSAAGVKVELHESYSVEWTIVKEETLVFEVTVREDAFPGRLLGYIGFGISKTGAMRGADILAITFGANGTTLLTDMHGIGNTRPVLDKQQDYKLIGTSRNMTHVMVKFSRAIDPCNPAEDLPITDSTQYLIWSYAGLNKTTNQIMYHRENRGARAVNLLDPVVAPLNASAYNVWSLYQDVVLTEKKTLYWCKFHKAPVIDHVQHIVGLSINLTDPLAKKHTHLASILACTPPAGQEPESFFGPFVNDVGYDCYYSETKTPRENCKILEFQWAFGGTPTAFPSDVGVPLGSDKGAYYMTMLHLDNPNMTAGHAFSTGYDLYYTAVKRKFEAGFFQVGINSTKTYSLTIPPSSTDYVLSSHCPAECTAGFPKEGITVFGYLLRSHLAGRKMRIRHFRKDMELPWLANDEHYDTNYQNNRMLRKVVKIMPGDPLTVECTFDSTDRNGTVVIGGLGLLEELCQAFLMYYPKVGSVTRCGSAYPPQEMLSLMNISSVASTDFMDDPIVYGPEQWRGQKYTEVAQKGVPWTAARRRDYQEKTRFGSQEAECTSLPRGSKVTTSYPKVKKAYAPPSHCKRSSSSSVYLAPRHLALFQFIGVFVIKLQVH